MARHISVRRVIRSTVFCHPSPAHKMPRAPKTYEQVLAIREYRRRARERAGQSRVNHRVHVEDRVQPADLAARRAEIPDDTRSLTARLMGDPIARRASRPPA